jgi:hypothetical protein
MRQELEEMALSHSISHCIDIMIRIYSRYIGPLLNLDIDITNKSLVNHDNTSSIDKVYNSYPCGLTFPPSITSLNNCTNNKTITSIIFNFKLLK